MHGLIRASAAPVTQHTMSKHQSTGGRFIAALERAKGPRVRFLGLAFSLAHNSISSAPHAEAQNLDAIIVLQHAPIHTYLPRLCTFELQVAVPSCMVFLSWLYMGNTVTIHMAYIVQHTTFTSSALGFGTRGDTSWLEYTLIRPSYALFSSYRVASH